MFEIGRQYEFTMDLGEGIVQFWGEVELYEHPLVKLRDSEPLVVVFTTDLNLPPTTERTIGPTPGRIINVTSSSFISAIRQDK